MWKKKCYTNSKLVLKKITIYIVSKTLLKKKLFLSQMTWLLPSMRNRLPSTSDSKGGEKKSTSIQISSAHYLSWFIILKIEIGKKGLPFIKEIIKKKKKHSHTNTLFVSA